MNLILRSVLLASLTATATAFASDSQSLLGDAFDKLVENQGHWSFRERQSLQGLPGGAKGDTILVVDPSKPYPKQYSPIQVEGRPPSAGELADYREIGDKVAKRRARDLEESGAHPGDRLRIRINSHEVTPDIEQATVKAEDGEGVTYVVPLRTNARGGSAYDSFQLTVRVNRARREFEHATIRQRQTVRIALVLSIADAVIDLDFTPVDPRYPSVITHIAQTAKVKLLFFRRAFSFELRRSGFIRVTPYDERFGVKVGPLRSIDF
ncbi:MAG TPA: hypothetical protein VII43_03870 [Opitutaceae bacterium]